MATKFTIVPTAYTERNALNTTRVIADGPGVTYIPAAQFFRIGMVNFGIQLQAIVSGVTPSLTLYPPKDALSEDPDVQATVPWKAFPLVAASNMLVMPFCATAVKLEFAGAGEAIIASF